MKLIYDWVLPVTNLDGTPIPASGAGSLVSTRIEFGIVTGSDSGVVIEERTIRSPKLIAIFDADQIATYFARAFVTNTFGRESITAHMANFIVGAP